MSNRRDANHVEIKKPTGKLTEGQKAFHQVWAGNVHVVRDVNELVQLLNNN